MVIYLPRAAWGARPPRGARPLSPAKVIGTAIHWPGMENPVGVDRVDDALRGWQNYHMDGRGWSDIAYQVAADQWGRAWTLRGLSNESAANGDADVNDEYGAILLVLAPGEQPSAAMCTTVRGVVADFRRLFPRGTRIEPHSMVRPSGTDCPGDWARAAIDRGDFTPRPTTTEADMKLTDPVPGLTDPDGSAVTLGESLARANYAYRAVLDGGAVDQRLDTVESRANYSYNALIDAGQPDGAGLQTEVNRLKAQVAALEAAH
jgi:hypothetical protein